MKKRINKTQVTLLVFSTLLFGTAVYFMSGSMILGASVGGSAVAVPAEVPAVDDQTATVPEEATTATTEKENVTDNQEESETPKEVYVVNKGETLWEIAQDSGLSIQTIMKNNQLSNGVVFEGQELVLNK